MFRFFFLTIYLSVLRFNKSIVKPPLFYSGKLYQSQLKLNFHQFI